MEIQDLIPFGMTRTEAKIFLELIVIGGSKIGELIKRTGLHRGTVYNALNDLIRKGFVSFVDKEGIRVYNISGKGVFINLLEKKEKDINSEKKKLEAFFKYMDSLKSENSKQEVSVFYSVEAFKTIFLGMYNECKENKIEYLFLGEGGKMSDAVGLSYYKYTQQLKRKSKISCRVILSKESKNLPYHKYVVGNIRYLPTKVHSPVNFWIYADKVIFVIWDSKPLVTIKIMSKQLADGFRNYFEGLWEMSEKDKKYFEKRHLINFYKFIEQAQESLDIMGICGIEPIHEGRSTILRLLRSGKKVRVLLANPESKNFKKNVHLEEKFIKDISESRILYEWKASIANLKDIKARLNYKALLEVRLFDKKPSYSIIIVDNEKVMYTHYVRYGKSDDLYASSKKTLLLEKGMNKEFEKTRKIFENYWKSAKPIKVIIKNEK